MLIGVLAIALPFLGFPSSFDTAISILIGLVIIGIAYNSNVNKRSKTEEKSAMPFTEERMKDTNGNQNRSTNSENVGIQNRMNINSESDPQMNQ